jgi:N-carbamoyl-L-amino-acid hydrolase
VALIDALAEEAIDFERLKDSGRELQNAEAYISSCISSRDPYLLDLDLPLGAVLGTFGVERHAITFRGQAAHSSSTPMNRRRDALLAAAKMSPEIYRIANHHAGVCTIEEAKPVSNLRKRETCRSWERLMRINSVPFDSELLVLCEKAIRETCGAVHRLPSGPLHDAAEVARAGVPTVMMFVQSLYGISHNKIEDTKEEHIEAAVIAFDRLAEKTMQRIGRSTVRADEKRKSKVIASATLKTNNL